MNLARKYDGQTPLYIACSSNRFEVVKLLVEYGADVNITEKNGRTPLYTASKHGHAEIMEYLLDHGANVNQSSPLSAACNRGRMEQIKILIAHGAEVNLQVNLPSSLEITTPLCGACEHGRFEVVKYLIALGADVNQRNCSDQTVLHITCSQGHFRVDIADILIQHEQQGLVNATDKHGWVHL